MANELITQFGPADFYRESSYGYNLPAQSCLVGNVRGLSFQKLIQAQIKEYYNLTCIVPSAAALGTGITVILNLVDDGQNSVDLGLVARFAVTPYNLSASGATVDFAAGGGTETAGNATLSSTTLNPVQLSIAIANAALNSLAVGNILGLRFRRVGDNSADTAPGRVVLLGGYVKNT